MHIAITPSSECADDYLRLGWRQHCVHEVAGKPYLFELRWDHETQPLFPLLPVNLSASSHLMDLSCLEAELLCWAIQGTNIVPSRALTRSGSDPTPLRDLANRCQEILWLAHSRSNTEARGSYAEKVSARLADRIQLPIEPALFAGLCGLLQELCLDVERDGHLARTFPFNVYGADSSDCSKLAERFGDLSRGSV